jgi:hypothetical protein
MHGWVYAVFADFPPAEARQKMPKVRTDTAVKAPQNLELELFVSRLAEKFAELLTAFIIGIEIGELSLELEGADDWLHSQIDEWCETEEPNRALHIRAMCAIMVWLILDELYVDDLAEAETKPTPEETAEKVQRVAKLSVEVIRTVQSIWGLLHGKA